MGRLAVIAALAAALLVPAFAIAGDFPPSTDSQGRIEGDPNTWIGFDLVRRDGSRRVRHISAIVPMNCYSGDHPTVEVSVPGSFKVRRYPLPPRIHAIPSRFFFARGDVETTAGPGEVDLYAGLRRHHHGSGEIEIETEDEALGKCYSGYLDFKVGPDEVPLPNL